MAKGNRKLSAYNRHVQSERKKGKTMKQAAASWRSKNKSTSSSRNSSSKSKPNGGNTRMGRRGGFNTQKLFKLVRTGALVAPAASVAMSALPADEKINQIIANYTGYDVKNRNFNFQRLANGWLPYIGASAITYAIPKLNSIIRSVA